MNDFSSKVLLLLAALEHYETTPADWENGILQGMFWLCDQLLEVTTCHPKHDYEHASILVIQAYIEETARHPSKSISSQAREECRKILPGIRDDDQGT